MTSVDRDLRQRIGLAWREMRRGAAAAKLKEILYSSPEEGPLDQALADALGVLYQSGPMRMGELADALFISPASTTRAVSSLAEKGYAERVKAADDQRSIVVSATPAGRARYKLIATRINEGLNDVLSEFTGDELVQLAEMFERFNNSLARLSAEYEAEN